MAKRVIHDDPKASGPFYLKEWMLIRGKTRGDLVEELDVAGATVSRWINRQRRPKEEYIPKIETFLGLEPGGLSRAPEQGSRESLLDGLKPETKVEALRYIEYLRSRDH